MGARRRVGADDALARHTAMARWSRGFYRLHRDDAGRMSRDDILREFNFSSWPCRIPPPAGGGGALGYVKLRNLHSAAWLMRRRASPRSSTRAAAAAAAGRQQARAARRAVVHPRVGRRRRPVSPRRGLPRLRPGSAVALYEMTAAGRGSPPTPACATSCPPSSGCKLDDLRKDVFVAQCLGDGAAATRRTAGGLRGRRRRRRGPPMRRYSDVW